MIYLQNSDKWRLVTDINDLTIKTYNSRKCNPILDEFLFDKTIESQTQEFTTRDIAEACGLFTIKNGKKVFYHDVIMNRLIKMVKNNKLILIDDEFKKTKKFKLK